MSAEGYARVLEFVDGRLDAIVTYPGGWGSVESLEPQILTLLELRLLLVHPQGNSEIVQVRYLEHVERSVGGPSTLPLVARPGTSEARVIEVLRAFVTNERSRQDGQRRSSTASMSA